MKHLAAAFLMLAIALATVYAVSSFLEAYGVAAR